MFEDSTFESAGRIHSRSRRWMIAAFTLNSSILLALVIIPLIYPEALPRPFVPFLVAAPPIPRNPELPKPQPVHTSSAPSAIQDGHIVVPTSIPTIIFIAHVPDAAPGPSSRDWDGTLPGGP